MSELHADAPDAGVALSLRNAYSFALRRYTSERSEALLQEAYRLGREAVRAELTLLHIADIHHEGITRVLRGARDGVASVRAIEAAGDFFREAVSAYEMLSRGFREAEDRARLERRHAAMLRQLSSFLADASLAVDAAASTDEILRLVAEHARDLLAGTRCSASARTPSLAQPVTVESSGPDEDEEGSDDWAEGAWTLSVVRQPAAANGRERQAEAQLSAPLVALDGTPLGHLHVRRDRGTPFTAMDEAVLLHLAEMAAAALERAWMYRQSGRRTRTRRLGGAFKPPPTS